MAALTRLQLPTRPRLPPPPIDSIRDITGAVKIYLKTSSIQVACRNSYKMIASRITALFIQYIWHDCIVPQEKPEQCIQYFKFVFLEMQNIFCQVGSYRTVVVG